MKKEDMRKEAIVRLEALRVRKDIVDAFKDKGELRLSFVGTPLELTESQKDRVHKFEEKTECMVYHVIQDFTILGEMLTFLYVSPDKEEWELDREDLKMGMPLAYVANLDDERFSEFGSVGVKVYLPGKSGLVRTA